MISLRPAAAADQKTIVQIVKTAQINPADLKWRNFIVALDDETRQIVSIGQIKTHSDGSRELASIATVPAYQRRGLAHQVIERLLAGHTGRLYLTCLHTMSPFYEQFGFRVIEEKEMTPYYRRMMKLFNAYGVLSNSTHQLKIMLRDA
ncbi:MAG: GNAT family N-acetyltransferase [Anaerolineales bacterium]